MHESVHVINYGNGLRPTSSMPAPKLKTRSFSKGINIRVDDDELPDILKDSPAKENKVSKTYKTETAITKNAYNDDIDEDSLEGGIPSILQSPTNENKINFIRSVTTAQNMPSNQAMSMTQAQMIQMHAQDIKQQYAKKSANTVNSDKSSGISRLRPSSQAKIRNTRASSMSYLTRRLPESRW